MRFTILKKLSSHIEMILKSGHYVCFAGPRSKGRDGHFRLTELASEQNSMKQEMLVIHNFHYSFEHKIENWKTSRYPFFHFSFGNEYWEKELRFHFLIFGFILKNEWMTDKHYSATVCSWVQTEGQIDENMVVPLMRTEYSCNNKAMATESWVTKLTWWMGVTARGIPSQDGLLL